jgi:hypothetical protein
MATNKPDPRDALWADRQKPAPPELAGIVDVYARATAEALAGHQDAYAMAASLESTIKKRKEQAQDAAKSRTLIGATAIALLAHEQGYTAADTKRGARGAFVRTAMEYLSTDPDPEKLVAERTIERWLAFATEVNLLP